MRASRAQTRATEEHRNESMPLRTTSAATKPHRRFSGLQERRMRSRSQASVDCWARVVPRWPCSACVFNRRAGPFIVRSRGVPLCFQQSGQARMALGNYDATESLRMKSRSVCIWITARALAGTAVKSLHGEKRPAPHVCSRTRHGLFGGICKSDHLPLLIRRLEKGLGLQGVTVI